MEGPQPVAGRSRRFDLALASAIVVLTQVEVWAQDDVTGASRAAMAAVLLLATSSLAWRRTATPACAAAVGAGLVAQAAITGTDLSSAGWTLAALVALYSAGAYLPPRRALAAAGLVVLGLAVRELRDLDSYRQDGYQNAFWWLLVVVPLGAGMYARSRRQASTLRRAAARTEAESAERARAAVAEERTRIAREVHDVVAHDVSAMVLQAEAAEEMLTRRPERARESLHAIQRLSREALSEMRQVLGIIRQDGGGSLAPQPTLADLSALIDRHRDTGLPVELRVEGHERRLPPGLEVSAYRVVQEALANIRKHADGAPATVTVRYEDDSLRIEVTDDGRGPATEPEASGHGLIGMRERVSFFGGEFTAASTEAGGFTVRATFPTASLAER
jgi:signal transduction histidine kinase